MKKYNLGGEINSLLPLLDLAIPGVGTALSAVMPMIAGMKKQATTLQKPTNPFRTFRTGGKLKSYDLPTHEQGGGMIDKMGNPSTKGVAEIEKKEVVYTDKRGTNPYVFSDTLKDSDGKTFAMKAKEYQKFDKKDQVNQATYKKLMNELQMKNDMAREMEEQVTNPTKMPNGGELNLSNPLLPTLGQFQYPTVKAPGQLQTMQQTDGSVVQDMTNLN